MARRADNKRMLSPKEMLIVDALRQASRPLSAYDLIEALHYQGVSSPPTVYRALKRLTDLGLAHRIESLNAFVSCAHGEHAGSAVFAICDACGAVDESSQDAVAELLRAWAASKSFHIGKITIELRGHCRDCAHGMKHEHTA